MGILPGSGPLGSGPTCPGSGFSVMPRITTIENNGLVPKRVMLINLFLQLGDGVVSGLTFCCFLPSLCEKDHG